MLRYVSAFGLCFGFCSAFCCDAALAQTSYQVWIEMQSVTQQPTPSFVSASATQNGTQTSALQACDGNTYYLAPSDLQTVQTALGNQFTVQLAATQQGVPPDGTASVMCVIQSQPAGS